MAHQRKPHNRPLFAGRFLLALPTIIGIKTIQSRQRLFDIACGRNSPKVIFSIPGCQGPIPDTEKSQKQKVSFCKRQRCTVLDH